MMIETERLKGLISLIKERIELFEEEKISIKEDSYLAHCSKFCVKNEIDFLQILIDEYLKEFLEFFEAFEIGAEDSALL